MMANIIIELKNIYFSYKEKLIIKDFSLSIEEGSFLCLLGESGSGKSTILRLINGLLVPDEGEVSVNGKRLEKSNCKEIRRDMGYVLQKDSLFPHLTIYQNMVFCLDLQGIKGKKAEERIKELMPLVGLPEELLCKYPHELSGGQRQRVGIIRAVAHKPKIVLMDEPFSALDKDTRNSLRKMVQEIHRKLNTTFVMVTHSEEDADILATKVVRIGE